ncbi:MAG TPA: hypothetical protein PKA62_15405 [Thermoanaerobaculia bacterium]|nr:hypothetical protein [Thermoanaerobaculia bacterium]
MRLDLSSLPLSPAGGHLGVRPDAWFRAPIAIAGVEHFLDLVSVRVGRHGDQHAVSKDLDAMVRLHHLACGADGPFATVTYVERPFVLFVTPACR